MLRFRSCSAVLIVTLVLLGGFQGVSPANEATRSAVAESVKGEVFQKDSASDWRELEQGSTLNEKQAVKTGPDGSATLQFHGKSKARVDVRPNSLLELSKLRTQGGGDQTEVYVSLGSILVKSDKLTEGSDFDVRTPKQIVGIRGTEFEVKVD